MRPLFCFLVVAAFFLRALAADQRTRDASTLVGLFELAGATLFAFALTIWFYRQPMPVRQREHTVIRRPHNQGWPVERRQPLRRLQRIPRADRSNERGKSKEGEAWLGRARAREFSEEEEILPTAQSRRVALIYDIAFTM